MLRKQLTSQPLLRYNISMTKDENGMNRYDMDWTIEGKDGERSGKLDGMHAGELEGAKAALKARAKRGDTVTTSVR